MNVIAKGLNLSGPQMLQKLDTYKNNYWCAKDFKKNTGAGIEESEGYHSLQQKINAICPCFDRMDALFNEKPNFTPMSTFDSSLGQSLSESMDGIGNPISLGLSQDGTELSSQQEVNLSQKEVNDTP